MMLQKLWNAIDRHVDWQQLTAPVPLAKYGEHDVVIQIVNDEAKAPLVWQFSRVLKRRRQLSDKLPLVTLDNGCTVLQLAYNSEEDAFTCHSQMRSAIEAALQLAPKRLLINNFVDRREAVRCCVYTALLLLAPLSPHKKQEVALTVAGCKNHSAKGSVAIAHANTIARRLTHLPPNVLSSSVFAELCRLFAEAYKLKITVYSKAELEAMGAGAILAVGRGSTADKPPAIIHLSYKPKLKKRVALVGKGVCFDTGGVNLKPAVHMRGMGKDMAGGATVLAAMVGLASQKYAKGVDAWIALVENDIGPSAYRPDEVITALNGKRIEVIHTDAEGRMILADTLTLASRQNPDTLISYATLTGTMHVALAERMSGFFATDATLREACLLAAEQSGERLCYFPMPADYKKGLKSEVADIKQCSEKGEADHILAALFLREFIEGKSQWAHLDLSAVACPGGLGALSGPLTGFGVAWTMALLSK